MKGQCWARHELTESEGYRGKVCEFSSKFLFVLWNHLELVAIFDYVDYTHSES
jgi:hypothetical protein